VKYLYLFDFRKGNFPSLSPNINDTCLCSEVKSIRWVNEVKVNSFFFVWNIFTCLIFVRETSHHYRQTSMISVARNRIKTRFSFQYPLHSIFLFRWVVEKCIYNQGSSDRHIYSFVERSFLYQIRYDLKRFG